MEQNETLGNMEQIIIVLSAVSNLHKLFITTLSSTYWYPCFLGSLFPGRIVSKFYKIMWVEKLTYG